MQVACSAEQVGSKLMIDTEYPARNPFCLIPLSLFVNVDMCIFQCICRTRASERPPAVQLEVSPVGSPKGELERLGREVQALERQLLKERHAWADMAEAATQGLDSPSALRKQIVQVMFNPELPLPICCCMKSRPMTRQNLHASMQQAC